MVEISKLMFDKAMQGEHCSLILHPWSKNCIKGQLMTYSNSMVGSAKFYSIIYLAQILMRGKKMLKKKEWIKMGEYYVRSWILGFMVTGSANTLGCLFWHLLGGRHNYYTYVLVPNIINGIGIYLEPPSRRGLIVNLFCNLMIEYWINIAVRAGYLNITKTKQTLMFMIGSSLLLYLMRLEGDKDQRTPLFWFFTPEKVRRKEDDCQNVCPHRGPCWRHVLKGFASLFGVGAAYSLAKLLVPKLSRPVKAFSSIRLNHFKMAMFFGGYIGIYKAVICYLCKTQGCDSALYALPAGYLAGLAFIFKPSLGFAIAALTGAAKLYSTILYEKNILPKNVPLSEMMYAVCQGTLFHARIMHADVCPKYVFNLMASVTNQSTAHVYSNLLEAIRKNGGA